MTAETQLGNALQANVLLAAIVGTKIHLDEVPEDLARPYILFAKNGVSQIDRALDNTVLHRSDPFAVTCVGKTRAQAIEMRALVETALVAVNQPPAETQSAYDETMDAETETVLVDWWT